jgi:trehalose 6-phosphate phosphatase
MKTAKKDRKGDTRKIRRGDTLEEALRALEPGALLAFDFDGTLAPIRRDPGAARLSAAVARSLDRLSKTNPVAIISGRSLADLRTKLKGFDVHLVGSHGFETLLRGGDAPSKGRPEWRKASRAWKRAIEGEIRRRPELRGVVIEDKAFSLSLHFRGIRRHREALESAREIALSLPVRPRLVGGHFVLNLVPERSLDKGDSLRRLMRLVRSRRAVFIGDDVTDEHVFEKRIPGVLGIRILRGKGPTKADFTVRTQSDVTRLLRLLVRGARPVRA